MTTTSLYRWLTELWAEPFLHRDRAALDVNLPSPPDRRRSRRATIAAPMLWAFILAITSRTLSVGVAAITVISRCSKSIGDRAESPFILQEAVLA